MSEQLQLQPMNSWWKGTSYVSPPKELTIKKALYYDFMMYDRKMKPFYPFLVQRGLTKDIIQQVSALPVIPALVSSSNTTTSIVKNEDLLHEWLIKFLEQEAQEAVVFKDDDDNDNIVTRVYTLENLLKEKGLNNNLFTPKTSEQIDENIGLLVSNITMGPYDCSKDAIMSAIMNGRFDEYLSEQNKQQMMRICGPVPVAAATAATEAAPQNEEKGFFDSLFSRFRFGKQIGGKKSKRSKKYSNKRSKNHSNKRSKKYSKKRSIKRSKSNKKYRGGAPVPYIGSIQGNYTNLDGQQLTSSPTGGIV
jgi:hypothetical protein